MAVLGLTGCTDGGGELTTSSDLMVRSQIDSATLFAGTSGILYSTGLLAAFSLVDSSAIMDRDAELLDPLD
jgi:hypothetical protein